MMQYSLIDANGKEHQLLARTAEDAAFEALKLLRAQVKGVRIHFTNEPSLFEQEGKHDRHQ